jgi:hypothetical protein
LDVKGETLDPGAEDTQRSLQLSKSDDYLGLIGKIERILQSDPSRASEIRLPTPECTNKCTY